MIISVVSAKGGVGKTTLTANVGASLVKDFGKKVLVIDGNITTPSLGIHLGILSQERTLDDVLEGSVKLYQAVYIHPCGLHVIPASLSPKTSYPDPEVLKEKVSEVKNAYDFILIDGAAGIGREVIAAITASDSTLIVTNPEMTSILAAIKVIKISKALNVQPIGLVVNKVSNEKHELKKADIEELCETKVISIIPYDKKVSESIKKMSPIVLSHNSPSAKAFRELASLLAGEEVREESFWWKIKRFFRL